MRKLATAAAVSLALASGGAFGLGLGEIEMQSALNQPMSAEIRLISVKPGELDGMIVQLASPEAFARAGIERSPSLTGLRFSVDQSSGTPVIKIESDQPVVEPFLNFLLEVDWPQGRMVREYTVLLDPPVFMSPSASERNAAADQPAVVQGGETALVVPTPIDRDTEGTVVDLSELEDEVTEEVMSLEEASSASQTLPDSSLISDGSGVSDSSGKVIALTDFSQPNTDAAAELQAQAQQSFGLDNIQVETPDVIEEVSDDVVLGDDGQLRLDSLGDDGGVVVSLDDLEEPAQVITSAGFTNDVTVVRGDTLFEIAENTVPSGASVQQMMLAILAANQSSFINNNINLVREGAILRIPEADQVTRLTQAQALAAISDQNQLWQDYRDSLRSTAGTQVAQTIAPEPNETVEADTDAATGAGAGAGAVTETIETAALESETAADGLSAEARAILENARQEILDGEELRIVADNAPSDTVASATADETSETDDTARIGAVNRRLQLAREELAASRMRTSDLSDQASQLQNTTQNLEAMVTLRQDEISRLEAQLANAREAAESGAQETVDNAAGDVADAANGAVDAAGNAVDSAADSAGDAADSVADATGGAVDAAGNAVDGAVDAAGNAVDGAVDAAGNAVDGAVDAAGNAVDGAVDAAGNAVDGAVDAAGNAVDGAVDAAGNAVDGAVDAAGNVVDAAGNAVDGTVDAAGNAVDGAADAAGDAVDSLTSGVTGAADEAADAAGNAITAAGDALDEVKPGSEEVDKTWYQAFLDDPKRMAIAGIGGLGLLGVLGTLLFRRKRREPDIDETNPPAVGSTAAPAAPDTKDVERANLFDGSGAFDTPGAAGVAGVAAATGYVGSTTGPEQGDTVDYLDKTFAGDDLDDSNDRTMSFETSDRSEMTMFDTDDQTESLDKDDTISEVDVYLAYGLHGQAEELLTKAIERNPDNPEYVSKLLVTYHAQGNSEAFRSTAADYHTRFGGNDNPEWPAIAEMGAELNPNEALYSSAADSVARIDSGHSGKSAMGENDFASQGSASETGSVNRDFSAGNFTEEETALMDGSLDPAFAFDEGDLEATGDFTAVTDELISENTVAFDDAGIAANEILQGAKTTGADALDSTMAAHQMDGLSDASDDLTLDLDQLSGDLELDSTELLNADLADLDLPDLTADNELLLDSTGQFGTGADEMDTMLDLAKAYIDMGDKDSASSALGEIVKSGSPEQINEAETLLRKMS